MSARYQAMWTSLAERGEGAFIPFVVVGDPDMETSVRIADVLVRAGADALELGIPFSDPVADGPTIQDAVVRALQAGATPPTCFAAIARIRALHPQVPIGVLTYTNAIFAPGPDAYYRMAQESGVDSVLAADLPVAEAAPFVDAAHRHGVDPVFIAPPNADEDTLAAIARLSRGYTYVVTRKGVTGQDDQVQQAFARILEPLQRHGAAPPVAGFGISRPEHVQAVLRAGARGAISGSAVVHLVTAHGDDWGKLAHELEAFVTSMKAATLAT